MPLSTFTVPIEDRRFEDYMPGAVYEFGTITVTQSEIIEFAQKYDPQYFHLDPEKAKTGPFSGMAASGWHTASMMMRLYVDNYLSKTGSMGGLGADLRWKKPVRPGDELRIRVTILEARKSQSNPTLGIVQQLVEVLNQNGDVVMTATPTVRLLRRET